MVRKEISLTYLPRPDILEFQVPSTHHTLITNDGSDLTSSVYTQLKDLGGRVVILNLPGVGNPLTEDAVTLSEYSDEGVKSVVQEIRAQYGKTGSFIHLHPHFEFKKGKFSQHFHAERDIIKALFFLAKHIGKDLNELGTRQRSTFVTVTRMDGKLGLGKRNNISVVGAGITGLVKCLNLEWSPVFCRALDIQPELPTKEITQQIIAELHDANMGIVEVAFSKDGRKTLAATPVRTDKIQPQNQVITNKSVFLVSGGARGVTATCIIELAKTYQCKFILLGRSSAKFEVPEFAQEEDDESTLKRLIMTDLKQKGESPTLSEVKNIYNRIVAKKEINETLNAIRNHGGEVAYLQGDVTNPKSFKAELNKLIKKFGRITGIVHGAGRIADKYIQDKTEADFENVLSVKLDGLLGLLSVTAINKLDHLILFSSVAGFYGNIGQTDYAIANEILNKAAHLFKTNHPKTHVSAINWGAWNSGMVSDELKARFEAAGVSLVDSAGGAAMFVNELQSQYADQPQVIIGSTLPTAGSYLGDLEKHVIKRQLEAEDNPFLMHHVIQGKAVLPMVNAVGWMANTCEELYPDYVVYQVKDTKLYKGIVFDGSENKEYIIELQELEKNDRNIVFNVTISSEGPKMPIKHYYSQVILINKKSTLEIPRYNHQLNGSYSATEGAVLYEDNSLFHGTYFQGIEQILEFSENDLLLSCRAPVVPNSEQGQFLIGSINTFFADIQYQGMVIWVQKYRDGAKSLPLQAECATIYKHIPFDKSLLVHIAIKEATNFKIVAECTVYDEHGTVYMVTEGAAITISKELVW